jgi:hypothetical protein
MGVFANRHQLETDPSMFEWRNNRAGSRQTIDPSPFPGSLAVFMK